MPLLPSCPRTCRFIHLMLATTYTSDINSDMFAARSRCLARIDSWTNSHVHSSPPPRLGLAWCLSTRNMCPSFATRCRGCARRLTPAVCLHSSVFLSLRFAFPSTMNLKLCMLCTQMVTRQCSTGQSCFQQPCHRMFIVGHPPDYVPRLQPYRVTEYLDAGARGIVAPYLESVEQAKMLVGATKLRPLKGTPFPLSRNRTKNRLSQSCQRQSTPSSFYRIVFKRVSNRKTLRWWS